MSPSKELPSMGRGRGRGRLIIPESLTRPIVQPKEVDKPEPIRDVKIPDRPKRFLPNPLAKGQKVADAPVTTQAQFFDDIIIDEEDSFAQSGLDTCEVTEYGFVLPRKPMIQKPVLTAEPSQSFDNVPSLRPREASQNFQVPHRPTTFLIQNQITQPPITQSVTFQHEGFVSAASAGTYSRSVDSNDKIRWEVPQHRTYEQNHDYSNISWERPSTNVSGRHSFANSNGNVNQARGYYTEFYREDSRSEDRVSRNPTLLGRDPSRRFRRY